MPHAQEHPSIYAALSALEAAPLSRKKAMLLVLLIDAAIDDARASGHDPLAHREAVAAGSPALALVMELAAMRDGGAVLDIVSREVPPEDYTALTEAEYMVSLYNGATVPRLVIRSGSGVSDAVPLLRQAVADLARNGGAASAFPSA